MGEGYFHNNGYDESRGGFSYGRLRMLHGGSYNAYFSDALLRAAWVEGDLADIAREPKWWHRDDPGMGMSQSSVEIRCLNDSFEVVVPEDNEDVAMQARPHSRSSRAQMANGYTSSRLRSTVHSWIARTEFSVCIELVHHLRQANL